MRHRNAKLTPFGRLLLVQRVMDLGWLVSQAAGALGISRPTAHKWLNRWRQGGPTALEDRSSRPQTSPRLTPPQQVEQIRVLRLRLRWGPHRLAPLVGQPRSTVYAVLRREGLARLRDLDRSTGVPVRYVRAHPGELIHVDMKRLGRIPAGAVIASWAASKAGGAAASAMTSYTSPSMTPPGWRLRNCCRMTAGPRRRASRWRPPPSSPNTAFGLNGS